MPSKIEDVAADIGGSEAEAPGEDSHLVVANASAMYNWNLSSLVLMGRRSGEPRKYLGDVLVGVKDMAPMSKDLSKEGMQPE